MDAAAPGGTVSHTGTWSGALTIAKPLTIVGGRVNGSVRITSSDVTLRSIAVIGPQSSVYSAGQNAIYAQGVSRITLDQVEAGNVGDAGVRLHYVTGFTILTPYVHDAAYAGIITTSSTDGVIVGGTVERIGMNGSSAANSGNAYGITLSQFGSGEPKAARITVRNVLVRNVPTWHGLDTHGGQGIIFENNIVQGTYRGIMLTGQGGNDNVARGNRIEVSSRPSDGRGILVSDNQRYRISGNVIVGPLPTGIHILAGSCGSISGDTITAGTAIVNLGSAC
ncbi:MAG: right-handed parallel beta-helix repeat-containing protein [Chloroflexi bacterium]|nr:right-handed parallel beta-helix repeat-containing protein [Chloroflexota bacterium]